MSNVTDFLGSKGFILQRREIILASKSGIIAPARGIAVIVGIGAGGSGGLAVNTTGRFATGGGAGEYAMDILDVEAGGTFSVTIGAGGAQRNVTGGTATNGAAGTDTTITGPNSYSLVCKGGAGGLASVASSIATSLAGGAGGSAGTGGTSRVTRYAGGRGGIANSSAVTKSGSSTTGGGGVNLFGRTAQTGTAGGDDATTGTGGGGTGGGGCGGKGGNVTGSSTTAASGGGSVYGDAPNSTSSGGASAPNILGLTGTFTSEQLFEIYAATLGYPYGHDGELSKPISTTGTITALPFSGGGACRAVNSYVNAGLGGGGGGTATSDGANPSISGAGGNGYAAIAFFVKA